jgi:tRNA A-37 threonylcarbamoyl transferase component Bud32
MTQTMEEAPADVLVGQTVAGKYKIVKLLGEGGMGAVYLAEQMLGSATKKVALKTLHKHLSHDVSIQKRFEREVGNLCALQHPNTIGVHDYGKMEDGTLYLVMEFVEGRSVADVLEKEGAMQPGRVENIFRQICGSLEEAHGAGIIHRDLKPDNVLLCDRAGTKDWVEVLDFGIAKRSSEHDPNEAKLTQQGMVLGTPPYMSPEQFTGQPVDHRSDIYALGVMAYEMLTGKYPFEANTAWEWASKHMTEPPRPIELQQLGAHVPEKMRHAIMRSLEKDKERRFNSVKEFYEAFASGAPGGTAILAPAGGGDMGPMSGGVRAKTEMGGPVMTPAPMTPAQMMGGGAPPAVVPAVQHAQAPAKGGGMGLVIGLGALAFLLLGGGAIAYFATRPKAPVIDPSIAGSVIAQPSVSVATPDPTPSDVPSSTPLTPGKPTTVVVHNPTTPAKPIPTPTPAKPARPEDVPQCIQARAAIKAGKANAPDLVTECRKAGGRL